MENMDKGLTVPKWVLIFRVKIPQMLQNLSAQFVCTSPKVWVFDAKRLHWASVVRVYRLKAICYSLPHHGRLDPYFSRPMMGKWMRPLTYFMPYLMSSWSLKKRPFHSAQRCILTYFFATKNSKFRILEKTIY